MFDFLEAITKQVGKHTTGLGAAWYILQLGFRVFVVATLASNVYGDEQDLFQCSVQVVGCTQQCYDQFARLSHVRFWSFQILFSLAPALLFHLYVLYVRSQIHKIEAAKTALAKRHADIEYGEMKNIVRLGKRTKKVGEYEMKNVKRGDDTVQIPHSRKIIIANLIHLFCRMIIEAVSIVIGGNMFNIQDGVRGKPLLFSQLVWNTVPGTYFCRSIGDLGVNVACSGHFSGGEGFVTCFIPRQMEKTVMLRYMNITSLVCVLLTFYEICAIIQRTVRQHKVKKAGKIRTEVNQRMSRLNRTRFNGCVMETVLMTPVQTDGPGRSRVKRDTRDNRDNRNNQTDSFDCPGCSNQTETSLVEVSSSDNDDSFDARAESARRYRNMERVRAPTASSSPRRHYRDMTDVPSCSKQRY